MPRPPTSLLIPREKDTDRFLEIGVAQLDGDYFFDSPFRRTVPLAAVKKHADAHEAVAEEDACDEDSEDSEDVEGEAGGLA